MNNTVISEKTKTLVSYVPKGQSPRVYIDPIKNQIMGVDKSGQQRPDNDLLLFLYVAKRTGLDPLTKQIYAIYRWDNRRGGEVMTIQGSIDGMRLVAQRSKEYAGQDDVIFDDETKKQPGKATVTVYKIMNGQRVPFTASARWGEYVQLNAKGLPQGLWTKMPFLMLGKCAEALALRKAFPNELSSIYTPEEMGQANGPASPTADLTPPERFKKDKPEEIQVTSGGPTEEPGKNDLNIEKKDNPTADLTPPAVITTEPEVSERYKEVAPNFAKMREVLKKKTVDKQATVK